MGFEAVTGCAACSHLHRTRANTNPSAVISLLQGADGQLLTGSARR